MTQLALAPPSSHTPEAPMTEPAGIETVRPAGAMTNDQYRDAIDQVSNVVVLVRLLPVRQMLAAISKVEALGPTFEPTAYRDGGARRLAEQQRILDALAKVQDLAEQLAGPIGGDRG